MRSATKLCLQFLMLGIVGLTGPAVAQEQPTAISDRDEDDVVSHLRRGRAARDAGRWSEAIDAFNAALTAAEPAGASEALHAEVLGELGLAELGLARYRDAAEHMARSLVLGASLPDFKLRRPLEAGQRSAERHVFRLYLGVNPPEAEVILDNKPIKHAPVYEIFLEPGSHTIRARLDGYGDFVSTFDAAAGKAQDVTIHLSRAPKARRPATAPPAIRAPWSTGDTLRAGGVILTATAGLAGGTLLIWGAAIQGDVAERRDELRAKGWGPDACSQQAAAAECSALTDRQHRRDVVSTVGLVSLAASGAIGAVTLGSFVVAHDEPNGQRRVRVAPLAGAGEAGITLWGMW